jgi:hypothetical protein
LRRALIVDPNRSRLDLLRREAEAIVDVTACTGFQAARRCLLTTAPAFLFSHFRLGAYNGLHLVHLAVHARVEMRFVLFDEQLDPQLAFEARQVGVFCETSSRLPFAIRSYLGSELPDRDRRHPHGPDRRAYFRGGRRVTDLSLEQLTGTTSSLLH